jgi:hypothetical protein
MNPLAQKANAAPPEPIWPIQPNRDRVPGPVQGVNRLALTSFLLALADVGAGIASLGVAQTAFTTPQVTLWWSLYAGNLVASVAAMVTARLALRRAQRYPHLLVRTGYAHAGLAIGVAGLVLLLCVGAPFGLGMTACAQGRCR